MRSKVLLLLYCLCFSFVCHAQSIESLIAQSEKIKVEKGEKSQEYLTMLDSIVQVANRAEKLNICYEYREKHMEIVKKVYSEQSAEYADDLIRLCNTDVRINQNYSSKVVEDYEKAVAIINKENRYINVYAYIGALRFLGYVYESKEEYDTALEYFRRILEIKEKNIDVNIQNYANILNDIGNIYKQLEKYEKALECYKKCIEVRKKTNEGKESLEYANLLRSIGFVYSQMGKNDDALNYYNQTLKIQKSILGENHLEYARTLNYIGYVYISMEIYDRALEYFKRGLDIRRDLLGKNSLEYALSLSNIADIYYFKANYHQAIDFYIQSLKIEKKINGEIHSDYAETYNLIGNSYLQLENYTKAIEYFEYSNYIQEIYWGKENYLYALNLNDIGIVFLNMGYANKALQYFEQSQNLIYNKEDWESTLLFVSLLGNMGSVYRTIGNYTKALECYEKCLESKLYQDVTPSGYAQIFFNIGNVYADMEDYIKAIEYYEKSRIILREILGETHPDYATEMCNIGIAYGNMKDYEKALEFLNQSIVIYEECFGKKHSKYANTLGSIGNIYTKLQQYDKAIKYQQDALKIISKALGKSHPDYLRILKNIGFTYAHARNYFLAASFLQKSFVLEKLLLHENFSWLTEKERELYWKKNKEVFVDVVRLNYRLPNDVSTTQTSFDAELLKKGLLLTSEIEFQKIIQESGDSTLLADFEKMRIIRIMLNKQYEKPIAERTLNCDSLERVADELEKHLVRNCKEYGDYTRALALTWQDVQKALGTHDIAIEFTDVKLNNDSTIYAALILTKDMESPKYVPLFEQNDFEKRLQESKSKGFESDSARGAMDSYRNQMGAYESTALYEMVWKPLEPYFPDSVRIYFAPSGLFYQIAVEYAPISETRTMSDAYEMYRVSSTKNLAMGYEPKAWTNASMYGGIEYDSDTTRMKSESGKFETRGDDELYNSTATYNSFAALNRDVQGHKGMKYLPGTKAEVEEIKRCLEQKNISTTLYEGAKASEESFKALGGSDMTILHIATHGFYLDADTTKYKVDMSMSQTGLMFAGSNLAWTNKEIPEGVEDGILTAKEISHVDLRKTDLVVLSACQTGLGKVTGEGVFGLQRGFKNAGVKTIIMSLWSVDDFATKLMMTEFYTHLADGKSKREAFNLAQAKVRATYDDPYYWAGFIMLD